jgi:hypothetical protein
LAQRPNEQSVNSLYHRAKRRVKNLLPDFVAFPESAGSDAAVLTAPPELSAVSFSRCFAAIGNALAHAVAELLQLAIMAGKVGRSKVGTT